MKSEGETEYMFDVFRVYDGFVPADSSAETASDKVDETKDSSLSGLGNTGYVKSGYMKKAVNTMQKDSILHEYQYFVGIGAAI